MLVFIAEAVCIFPIHACFRPCVYVCSSRTRVCVYKPPCLSARMQFSVSTAARECVKTCISQVKSSWATWLRGGAFVRTRLRVFAVAGVLGTCVCARTRAYAYARARVHAYARARWSAARALRGQVRSYVRAFLRESSGVTRRLAKASNGDPDLATSDGAERRDERYASRRRRRRRG